MVWLYPSGGPKELWAWTLILTWKTWKVSSVVAVFKNIGERSTPKNTTLLVFFLWLIKSENLVNNRIVDHLLGRLDQLQILWQLYLIKLLGVLTGLELLELSHLIYPRLLTGFSMLVFLQT